MRSLILDLDNPEATEALGRALARAVPGKNPGALLLYGDPGAGKSTLACALARALPGGSEAECSSPSFTICNIYYTAPVVHHFDLYRLMPGLPDEALEESLDDASVLTLVEWPENMPERDFPRDGLICRLMTTEKDGQTARRAAFESIGPAGADCLRLLAAEPSLQQGRLMRITVQKFGGTSVADKERMLQVLERVRQGLASGSKMLVVLSARAGDTNGLLALAREWSEEPDQAECDALVSTGEQISVALFCMLLRDAGIRARSCNGQQLGIRTNATHGKARIRSINTDEILRLFQTYDVLVVTGFQGVTEDGRITTLGRGGSDTSAVALAAASGAELCEIYTDVEGVFTTDPNICAKARKLERVSYDEMLEMASMGAKVLEIRSVEFAKKFKVPVLVRSTFSDAPGTLVTQEDQNMENIMVSGIAYDKDQARITLRSVPDRPGVAASIFRPLAEGKVSVDMIVQNPSRDGVTDMNFTVSRKDLKQALAIMEEIRQRVGGLEVLHDDNVAKVSAIGVGMRNHSGVASKTFAALQEENINIIMISTSEIKISCVIDEKYTELAVRTLHDAFGLEHNPYLEE